MIKLSPRLMAIACLVKDTKGVIDIGCDHGLLSIYLYLSNICHNIIASDINYNALNNATGNIKKYNLEDKIKTVISDGLDNISIKKDSTIIISGMGSKTIIDILRKGKDKLPNASSLILQSNNNLSYLRSNVINLGFMISNEVIVKDKNNYYTIIVFQKGKSFYTRKQLKYGPILLKSKSEEFINYINNELNNKCSIRKKIPRRKIFLKIKLTMEILTLKQIRKDNE